MAGLGLSDAVSGYQEGVNWKLKNDEAQRQAGIQKSLDAVNQATAQSMKTAEADDVAAQQKAWLAGGGESEKFIPKTRAPSDSLMFKFAQDRGTALMRAGLIDQAVQNEAAVQAQRIRVRQGALERFRMDRDHAKLATAIYDTIPDGKSITEATTVEGAPALNVGSTNMPAMPTKLQLKLSDGSVHSVTPQDVEETAMRLSDPQYAAHEAAMRLAQMKETMHANRELAVKDREGENQVRLEGVKGKNKLGEIDRAHTGTMEVLDSDNSARKLRTDSENKTRMGVAGIAANATLGAASLGKQGRVEGAAIAGSAHVRGAEIAADARGAKTVNAAKSLADMHGLVMKTVGERMQGALGGNRIGSEQTLAIANMAQAAVEQAANNGQVLNPGVAAAAAIDEWSKRGVKPMPGESRRQMEKRRAAAAEGGN